MKKLVFLPGCAVMFETAGQYADRYDWVAVMSHPDGGSTLAARGYLGNSICGPSATLQFTVAEFIASLVGYRQVDTGDLPRHSEHIIREMLNNLTGVTVDTCVPVKGGWNILVPASDFPGLAIVSDDPRTSARSGPRKSAFNVWL